MPTDPNRPEPTFSIRDLCIAFGLTPRTLRFYENQGLLSPARDGLNRVYYRRDRARLILILRGKRLGLSLTDIRELLDSYQPPDGGPDQHALSLSKFRRRITELQAERQAIDDALAELHIVCAQIEGHLATTRPDLLAGMAASPVPALDGSPGLAAK
jgi:DNA-binding transcriptional MerR regulator